MKTTRILKRITPLYFLAILFVIGCNPEDGDQGPIGPAGPQGEQGPAGQDGADGQDGAQGETGSANVIYSDWIDSGFENDITDGFDAFNIDAPEITQEILDTGIILVYARSTTNTIYQVPVTFYGFLNESYFFRIINAGTLNIGVEGIGTNNIGEPFLNDVFRYVIIPGGQQTTGKQTPPDYTKMSYDEIAKLFGIKD